MSCSPFKLAPFRFDVTPPLGHSLCGGWIKPAVAVDDPLEGLGYVLIGAGQPIVVCVLDWTALLNEAHLAWRTALAEAAGTTVERVAVHCVHQHNAPFVCDRVYREVSSYPDLPRPYDADFFARCLRDARLAVSAAIMRAEPVTHVAASKALVQQVASNRRIARDGEGRVTRMRRSFCTDSELQALPEGEIDPFLRTICFYNEEKPILSAHFYATHPMSYYEDGRVSADFCGLARRRRQSDDPGCLQVYFTGCAGNVTAGKYNDGSPAARVALTERMYDAMCRSEALLRPEPLRRVQWRETSILPPTHPVLDKEELRRAIAGKRGSSLVERILPAFKLAWLERREQGLPVPLSCLTVNDHALLHLPAELFVHYQLRAQAMRPDRFVAVAAYGDDGPWYVPTQEEYPTGGYEVSVAFCDPSVDTLLTEALRFLLSDH
ncbi:MAG TPA: hypothetical protein PLN52_01035 [Opitutaceae bacterium]|nr:hypothetical protein [Opitutaceae bacterium]